MNREVAWAIEEWAESAGLTVDFGMAGGGIAAVVLVDAPAGHVVSFWPSTEDEAPQVSVRAELHTEDGYGNGEEPVAYVEVSWAMRAVVARTVRRWVEHGGPVPE